MGLRGPQRLTQEDLIARGSRLAKRPDDPMEMPVKALGDADLTPPPDLNESEIAIWNWLTPILLEKGFFTKADVHNVILYCQDSATLNKLNQLLEDEGYTVTVENSAGWERQVENPLFKITSELCRRIRHFNDDYGMSPKARLRVPALQKKKMEDASNSKSRFFTRNMR